eukprot:8742960-Lingulodinium_polyedra.AAC.1
MHLLHNGNRLCKASLATKLSSTQINFDSIHCSPRNLGELFPRIPHGSRTAPVPAPRRPRT